MQLMAQFLSETTEARKQWNETKWWKKVVNHEFYISEIKMK